MTTLAAPSAPSAPSVSSARLRRRAANTFAGVLLVGLTLAVLVPIYIMVVVSLHPADGASDNAFAFPTHPAWHNYVDAFTSMNYLRNVENTLVITLSTAVLTVLTGSLAGWAIARRTRRWTRTVYQVFVSGLTIPVFVIITPLYMVMRQLHMLDSPLSVVLGETALSLPFAVFFFTGFVRSIPAELEEAAAVDGAGLTRTFVQVVFPLLRPATLTLAIFVVLQVWNDLVLPLVLLSSDDQMTVTQSVYNTIGTHSFNTSQLLPTLVLGVIPLFVVFALLQRYVVAGIAVGTGK